MIQALSSFYPLFKFKFKVQETSMLLWDALFASSQSALFQSSSSSSSSPYNRCSTPRIAPDKLHDRPKVVLNLHRVRRPQSLRCASFTAVLSVCLLLIAAAHWSARPITANYP